MAALSPHCRAGRRLRRRARQARRLYLRRRIAAKRSICRRSTPHTARRGSVAKSRQGREERGERVAQRLASRSPCCRPTPHTARRRPAAMLRRSKCGGSRRRERRLSPPGNVGTVKAAPSEKRTRHRLPFYYFAACLVCQGQAALAVTAQTLTAKPSRSFS